MVAQLGTEFGKWFFRHQAIQKSQINLIRYAIEIICSEFLELMFMIVYSLITNRVIETVMFIVFFQMLRRMYDGYHAKTIIRCLMITISVFLLIICSYTNLSIESCYIVLSIVLFVQFICYIENQKLKSFFASFSLIGMSMIISLFEYESMIQILTLTQVIVLISYLPVRRLK